MQHKPDSSEECPAVETCPYATRPVSVGERIRAMTDTELAHFIAEISDCCGCPAGVCSDSEECEKHLVEYLNKNYKEVGTCF